MNEDDSLKEEKKALIDLIVWYRDEYHRKDFGHTEMIEKIKQATTSKELDSYHQITDFWLD